MKNSNDTQKSTDFNECLDKMKKFYGVVPYDGSSNYLKGDGWFYSSIERDFDADTIKEAKEKIQNFLKKVYKLAMEEL